MYYDKEIDIYNSISITDKETYATTEKYIKENEEPYMVDVQPYSSDKAEKDYGYKCECIKRIFCDSDLPIKENSVILYKNKTYKVIAPPIDWDDYMVILIKDEVIEVNNEKF